MVVWPDYSNFSVRYGGDNFDGACESLNDLTSLHPSPFEAQLCDFVLKSAETSPSQVAHAVCKVACQWQDPSLWSRAVIACGKNQGLAILGEDEIFAGIFVLGFENITKRLDYLLQSENLADF